MKAIISIFILALVTSCASNKKASLTTNQKKTQLYYTFNPNTSFPGVFPSPI